MNRAERRDRTERKAKSRKRKLLSVVGAPSDAVRQMMAKPDKTLDREPDGKFRNNSIANKYASRGISVKTNRRKGHSVHRAKLGAYGPAMNWKASDRRRLDAGDDEALDDPR